MNDPFVEPSRSSFFMRYIGRSFGDDLVHGSVVELHEDEGSICGARVGDLVLVCLERKRGLGLYRLASARKAGGQIARGTLTNPGGGRKLTFDAKRGDEIYAVVTGVVRRIKREN